VTLYVSPGRPCYWIIQGAPCGLLHDHDGDHTPHEVGGYLPAPLLHPLAILALHRPAWPKRCPLCRAVIDTASWSSETLIYPADDFHPAVTQTVWEFGPCGCEGRTLLTPPTEHT